VIPVFRKGKLLHAVSQLVDVINETPLFTFEEWLPLSFIAWMSPDL